MTSQNNCKTELNPFLKILGVLVCGVEGLKLLPQTIIFAVSSGLWSRSQRSRLFVKALREQNYLSKYRKGREQ